MLSGKVRIFVDECVGKLRSLRLTVAIGETRASLDRMFSGVETVDDEDLGKYHGYMGLLG
jgi:hypothetical protein